MNLNHLMKAGIAIVAAAASFGAIAAPSVAVSVVPVKTSFGPAEDVIVRVTMTNVSGTPQYVLKYHTPFIEVEESLFEVTRDGQRVPYLGAHYKRTAPTAADYFLLKPGASHSRNVELTALYDMSVTGDYAIRYAARSQNLFAPSLGHGKQVVAEAALGEITSESVSLWIDGRHERGYVADAPAQAAPSAGGSLSFSGCSSTQASTITSAVGAAKTMSGNGLSYLQAGTVGTRYTKWFGSYTSSRYSSVKSHFSSIKDAFDNKAVVVDCSCKQSYYAYVYPTKPYKIYVCNAFWKAPMTGTDSKGGTLVHEMSHFNATAGTEDWAYGQSAAASLAISSPSKAIDNADSHEYFGENSPSLP